MIVQRRKSLGLVLIQQSMEQIIRLEDIKFKAETSNLK